MSRDINADKMIYDFEKLLENNIDFISIKDVVEYIEEHSTKTPKTVSEWIEDDECDGWWVCSNCGAEAIIRHEYCSYCGARFENISRKEIESCVKKKEIESGAKSESGK